MILDRTRGGAYVAVFLSGIAIFGVFLFLTYYMQVIKGLSPLNTGLLFLPLIGCILISSNLSSIVLLPRVGPRALIAAGMLLGVIGMVYLTQLTCHLQLPRRRAARAAHHGPRLRHDLRPGHQHRHRRGPRQDSGVASALVNTMQQVGGSIGTSALSTIALTATASYLIAHHTRALAPAIAATHGYTLAFAVSAGLFGLGLILAIGLLPSRRRLEELRSEEAAPTPAPAVEPASAGPAAPGNRPLCRPGNPPLRALRNPLPRRTRRCRRFPWRCCAARR